LEKAGEKDPWDLIGPLRKEWTEARYICEGVIGVLRNQYEEEKKKLEERLHIEENIRSEYRNRRY
jgi:hypothetical protein